MAKIARLGAFDRPFQVRLVNGEILLECDQAPLELVFTRDSAKAMARQILAAADDAQAEQGVRPPGP